MTLALEAVTAFVVVSKTEWLLTLLPPNSGSCSVILA